MVNSQLPSRRNVLRGVGGLSAGLALAAGAVVGTSSRASAGLRSPSVTGGHGLAVADANEDDPRMWYYQFHTDAIGWEPMVNVFVPQGYRESTLTYPVLYLLHGGLGNFISFDQAGIRDLAANKEIIIVMPDGGAAGWYSNPVTSNAGPRNWETFHMDQLVPWIDDNFRTYAEFGGRAVSGFSMGGFGALKYAAKYYGHFASVSSHSGPASIRRDLGAVAHWANTSSMIAELAGGTIYGVPWDEARVSADNAVENIESYRGKRVFLAAGTQPDPLNLPDRFQEEQVLAGHREFRDALDQAGIAHDSHEHDEGHVLRHHLLEQDLQGVINHLHAAG